MPSWRDELVELVKSKAEREEEDKERHRKRVEEALATAEAAIALGTEALGFARGRLSDKGQPAELVVEGDSYKLVIGEIRVSMELQRENAVIKIAFGDGKPREFDFAKDRHITPADVEEYIGRRALELVRAAQKASPW